MDEKEKLLFSKRKKIMKIHLLIIMSSIPQIILGFFYFIIYLKTNYQLYLLIQILLFLILSIIILIFASYPERNHYLIGLSLSIIFSFSFSMIFFTNSIYYPLYLYFITLCIYHYTEFFSVLLYHFEKLSCEYFLIDQSLSWIIATFVSFIETILETYYFNKYKKIKIFFIIGLIMTIIGQIFRIGGIYTGKKNFTHKISYKKKSEHKLVTTGFFSISRHPSYFGFFIWSIGIEIMCCNPICTIAFTIILFHFFKDRILTEEQLLIQFFGEEYLEYKNKVGILIPFIHLSEEKEEENLKIYKNKMKFNKSAFI
jgi:protein-S-isoprenylcysteine O-methyltransferase